MKKTSWKYLVQLNVSGLVRMQRTIECGSDSKENAAYVYAKDHIDWGSGPFDARGRGVQVLVGYEGEPKSAWQPFRVFVRETRYICDVDSDDIDPAY